MAEPWSQEESAAAPAFGEASVVAIRRASGQVVPAVKPPTGLEGAPALAEDEEEAAPAPSEPLAHATTTSALAYDDDVEQAPTLLQSPTPRPHWDPWSPIWLRPLIRLLLLDEHGPMPRTVAAQVGFAAVLMALQAAVDMLAWTLGLRWVFVDALGPGGWALTIGFAGLISAIILIFERFVITAAVPMEKSPLTNKGTLIRIGVVLAFAMVTAIPVEMMIFHDVIQGRIGGEVEGRRVEARGQLLGEVDGAEKALAEEERAARQSVKLELPEVVAEKVDTGEIDKQVVAQKATLPPLEKAASRAVALAKAADGRLQRAKARQETTPPDATASVRRARQLAVDLARANANAMKQRADAAKDALAVRQRQITDLDSERTGKQTAVDSENERKRKEATEEHQKSLTAISERFKERRAKLDTRRREIEAMTDVQLAAATKRTFQPPDGFARRWQLMHQLEQEDELFGWTKWAVRVLFVGLSLLVLASKSFFHRRTRAYYLGFDPMDRRIGSL